MFPEDLLCTPHQVYHTRATYILFPSFFPRFTTLLFQNYLTEVFFLPRELTIGYTMIKIILLP